MLQITSDQLLYKSQAVGPSMLFREPLLPTARQLRKRWDQRIQLLGNGVVFFDQPCRSYGTVNRAVVVGQIASIQQRKLPPFQLNKLLKLGVIAQSTAHVIHLPTFIGTCWVRKKMQRLQMEPFLVNPASLHKTSGYP